MNPFAFLVGLIVLIIIIFLITNVLYPFLNKDVEYFWFFKTDWFERNRDIKEKEEEEKKDTIESAKKDKS